MDISIFLQQLDSELFPSSKKESLGNSIDKFQNDTMPSIEDADVVLVGVQEDRASDDNLGASWGVNVIREEIYKLYGFDELNIADIGNIAQGNDVNDTYKALEEVVFEVLKRNKVLFIIGGSRDLAFSAYKAYGRLEQTVNFCSIDPRLNMDEYSSSVTPNNFINHIVLHQPNYLFNYSALGYQTYLVPQSHLSLMNDLHFDAHRLGSIQGDIKSAEPILRYSDFVSVNINSVRFSEIGLERSDASPNGFYGEEICQLMRYAGISDKLSCLGVFDYNPILNESKIGAKLVAQMFWCFIDGVASRKGDFPAGDKSDYLKYTVSMDDQVIEFLKSDKSDRWWMKVPYPPHEKIKFERHHLIPCSHQDYVNCAKGIMPDLWFNTYKKLR